MTAVVDPLQFQYPLFDIGMLLPVFWVLWQVEIAVKGICGIVRGRRRRPADLDDYGLPSVPLNHIDAHPDDGLDKALLLEDLYRLTERVPREPVGLFELDEAGDAAAGRDLT